MAPVLWLVLLQCAFISPVLTQWSLNNFLMSAQKGQAAFAKSVTAGGMIAIEECQHQFRWDPWNCPHSSVSLFNENSFPTAIREVAFLNSILSAGVMYVLTLNCSMGQLSSCGCDNTKIGSNGDNDWQWGGCSDNVDFGNDISRQYIDEMESGTDARAVVNLHNNEAGRRAVKRTMQLSCKCHGVSGSCSIRTCWKELPSFREVGDYLKRKYKRAVLVDADNGRLRKGNSASRRGERDILQISSKDLVFLENSPNFCFNNSRYGTLGTLGRECSKPGDRLSSSRSERKSCSRLCKACGYKIKRTYRQETSTCNCKFHWCCEVKCEQCTKIVERLTCIPR